MYKLQSCILQVEALLEQDTTASLTYAALECRLAIELICYERLRHVHDYISHDDLRKWQPRDIVNILIQEVDPKAASTFTLQICKEPWPENSSSPTLEDYEGMEFLPVGTQIGFDPGKLGKLWHALANLALHVRLPINKDDVITQYGDPKQIRAKVEEALVEIKRINEGTMIMGGIGEEVSFLCNCGVTNKRKLRLMKDGQRVNCINRECDESYDYVEKDMSFLRREVEIVCKNCCSQHFLTKKKTTSLPTDHILQFSCQECDEKIYVSWRLHQANEDSTPKNK